MLPGFILTYLLEAESSSGFLVPFRSVKFDYQCGQVADKIGLSSFSISKETSWLVWLSSEICLLALKVTVKCCESNCL